MASYPSTTAVSTVSTTCLKGPSKKFIISYLEKLKYLGII
jgi:hypothetical protein